MKNIYYNLRLRLQEIASDNRGVAAVEVILILVVLIGLVVVFKSNAAELLTKIWNAVTKGASSVTG